MIDILKKIVKALRLRELKTLLAKIPMPKIKGINQDKMLHIVIGLVGYCVLFMILRNSIGALWCTLIIAIGVEIMDWLDGKGHPDPNDALATVAIPIIITAITYLV
jgi:hypothetical protein